MGYGGYGGVQSTKGGRVSGAECDSGWGCLAWLKLFMLYKF